MKLTILRPYEKKEHQIIWLEVNSSAGNFVFQDGHEPTILLLSEDQNLTYCLKDGTEETYKIPGGVLNLDREQATIILNK